MTATRIVVFGVKFSYRRGVTLSGPHGTWQRSTVTATKKRVKLVTGGGADMLWPGSRRTLQVARELAGA